MGVKRPFAVWVGYSRSYLDEAWGTYSTLERAARAAEEWINEAHSISWRERAYVTSGHPPSRITHVRFDRDGNGKISRTDR